MLVNLYLALGSRGLSIGALALRHEVTSEEKTYEKAWYKSRITKAEGMIAIV